MKRALLFAIAPLLVGCHDATAPSCEMVIKGKLLAILTQRDAAGRVVQVDSIYSRKEAIADTTWVCQ